MNVLSNNMEVLGKTLVLIEIHVKNKLYLWKPVLDRGCDMQQLLWISPK